MEDAEKIVPFTWENLRAFILSYKQTSCGIYVNEVRAHDGAYLVVDGDIEQKHFELWRKRELGQ